MIFDRGRAFEFLAWYRPLVLDTPVAAKPDLTTLGLAKQWSLRKPGTCSAQHLKGMELENIGQLAVDRIRLERAFPFMPAGIYQAVNDISIATS